MLMPSDSTKITCEFEISGLDYNKKNHNHSVEGTVLIVKLLGWLHGSLPVFGYVYLFVHVCACN